MEGAEDGAVVEVRVAAKGLSCRDACVRLRVKPPGKEWELFAQTEVVPNEPSPSFMHGFRLPYVFGEIQHVRFEVTEGAATLGSEGHVLGTVTTTLADLVAAGGKVTRDLGKGASLKLFAEEVVRSDAFCSLFISCANLDKKDLFGKADPFFVLSRQVEGTVFCPVYKSAVRPKTLDPVFDKIEISVEQLCNGDITRPIKVDVFDWSRTGKHELIGFATTSVEELSLKTDGHTFVLLNPAVQAAKKNYRGSGQLSFNSFSLGRSATLSQYIRGGLKLRVNIALDCSASNGNLALAASLHNTAALANLNFSNFSNLGNAYVGPMMQVAASLGPVCRGEFFLSVLGAKRNGITEHYCPLSNEAVPSEALVDVYRHALDSHEIGLSGPLLFCETISTCAALIPASSAAEQHYGVLVILTNRASDDHSELIQMLNCIRSTKFCTVDDLPRLLKRVPEAVVKFFSGAGIQPCAPGADVEVLKADVSASVFSSLRDTRKHQGELNKLRTTWKI